VVEDTDLHGFCSIAPRAWRRLPAVASRGGPWCFIAVIATLPPATPSESYSRVQPLSRSRPADIPLAR
jgi:hypothetical protein